MDKASKQMKKLTIWKADKKYILIYCFVILLSVSQSLQLNAQHSKIRKSSIEDTHLQHTANVSKRNTTACSGLFVPNFTNPPFLTNIKNLERKHKSPTEVEALKAKKTENKLQQRETVKTNENAESTSSLNISVATNFQANIFNGGAPPDNTIAIANNGNIVSVINCNIAYFNSNGNQLWTGSFWELFNDPSLTEIIYDSIVVYDSQADRFVMIAIHGFTSATSKLIVSFSKTNNPTDGWWIYKLSGNPLNDFCWLDYPKLGISNNEIFVTGNLFNDNTGFSESVIYQIDKNNGYLGANLDWILWSNIVGSHTGIAFKYNPSNPEVWVSGCYGSSQTLFNTNYNCFNN